MSETIKVAAVNSWSEPLAIEKNIAGITEFLKELDTKNVHYALFPELCVSGYINNTNDLKDYTTLHESVVEELAQLSSRFNVTFSVGLPLPLENSWGIGQLTFRRGIVIHTHYKTHLSVHEKEVYVTGSQIELFQQELFNIGMLLCLESHYPELSLLQQRKGAHLLCFAFASPRETAEEKLKRFKMMLQARAYDNACFVMACNQTGKTPSGKNYAGVAVIISPRAEILAECCGMNADFCIAELDMNHISKIRYSLMSNFPAYRNCNIDITFKIRDI